MQQRLGKTITLASTRDVERLLHSSRPHLFPTKEPIILAAPGMSPEDIAQWQQKLTALRSACGCGTGTAFVFIAGATYLVYVILSALATHHSFSLWHFLIRLLLIIPILLVAAGIGKAVGLAVAQIRFKKACSRLLIEFKRIERKL